MFVPMNDLARSNNELDQDDDNAEAQAVDGPGAEDLDDAGVEFGAYVLWSREAVC